MVIHLTETQSTWEHTFTAPNQIDFASASARSFLLRLCPPHLHVFFTPPGGLETEVDCVTLWVAHSWWRVTDQPFCPDLTTGSKLRLAVEHMANGVDVRIDFDTAI